MTVDTESASPFASSLLFGYIGAFIYDGDAPLAERRAQALSLDTALLAELLGSAELRELIDADALSEIELELQRLTDNRRIRSVDDTHDALRILGDLSSQELMDRGAAEEWLVELQESRRAIVLRIAGELRWMAIEDAGRFRDALGVPLPVGIADAFLEPVKDPLGDLIGRFARTHGPFRTEEPAVRLGLGQAVVQEVLQPAAGPGPHRQGRVPARRHGTRSGATPRFCGRSGAGRSPSSARRSRRSTPDVLGRFLPAWHGVGSLRSGGVDALVRTIEQLQGTPIPGRRSGEAGAARPGAELPARRCSTS